MKTCKDCKEEKKQDLFYGIQGECKECTKKRVKEYVKKTGYDQRRQRLSKRRIFQHRYSGMKARIEGRAVRNYPVEGKELLTKEEFYQWCEDNMDVFEKLYCAWEKSDWSNKLAPSIDRIDNTRGYAVDNIRWMTKSKNSKKYNK